MNSENHIRRAYQEGLAHGREDRYDPPAWMLQHPAQSLWITAYQHGYREGQSIVRAEKMMAKGEHDAE